MNITKYKIFSTFLIKIKMDWQRYNHRDQWYENFEFLSMYYETAIHKGGVCVISTSKVHFYTNMEVILLSYPFNKQLFEGICQASHLKEIRIWLSTY